MFSNKQDHVTNKGSSLVIQLHVLHPLVHARTDMCYKRDLREL